MKIKDIRLLEIELHSQCNRTCGWCPNYFIDRKSYNKFLDDNVFNSLITELKNNLFNGYISFSRYNEPLLHRDNLEDKIKIIRKELPTIKLVTNTNGDYNYNNLDIDELTVMDYDRNKEIIITDNFRMMRLDNINNRGGLLKKIKQEKRIVPCHEPEYFVGVNYDGTISPCCNIRNDIEEHKPYILGDLHNNTLTEILNSTTAIIFRTQTANKLFPPPCEYCNKMPGRYTSRNGIGGKQT